MLIINCDEAHFCFEIVVCKIIYANKKKEEVEEEERKSCW